ncbi:MAG: hypothetical protein JKY95_04105, partial [Planctomycetaceae bacterium]|nr:hypothetical protein [Planctomycetaceae bacterium]
MKVYPTSSFLGKSLVCLLVVLTHSVSVWAQLPVAQLRSIFPPGGQAGHEVKFSIVEGTDLDEISNVIFNHPGIQLQGKLDPLTSPMAFTVKIAADVPPGYYSVRVQSRYGVSNPRMFRVDSLPVKAIVEADLKKQSPLASDVNSVIYSRCEAANDIDEYSFNLAANKTYNLQLDSLSIDSLMSSVVEIYQPNGRRLVYRRQVEREDPRVLFTSSEAGTYRVKVYDFLYKGAASYGYRLSLTDSINPSSLNPPMLLEAKQQTVKGLNQHAVTANSNPGLADLIVADYNLQPSQPMATTAISGYVSPRRTLYQLLQARLPTVNHGNELRTISVAKHPIIAEVEPNNTGEKPQKVSVPSEIYGRFLKPGDVDVYTFQAKKGEKLWLQVFSERDGQSLDPYLKLEQITKDAKGVETVKAIAIPDDVATNLYPNVFDTLTDDIDYLLTAAADATFRVTVSHRYHFAATNRLDHYRLRISAPQPTFRAVAMVLPNITGALTADTP